MPKNRSRKTDNRYNPLNRRKTRSTSAPERAALLEKIQQEAEAAAEALRIKREKTLADQPKAQAGNRGDGNFHLAFVQMGQGDCAIMSTPGGKTLMIDCGSDATEQVDNQTYINYIRGVIYGAKFLKDSLDLDYLIFTHPDSDHYNRLKYVLDNRTKIHKVIHSSELEYYSVGQTSAWVKDHVAHQNFLKAVSINEGGPKINGSTVTPDSRGAIEVLNEKDGAGKTICLVSILCSNVATDTAKDNSNDTNRGSVVTLIEVFGKKIIICGDATRSTEKFLVDRYGSGTLLDDMDVAQAPHHGSAVTSSSDAWVGKVRPRLAVISAGKQVDKDHLPSLTTISKYLAPQTDNTVANHELFYWEPGALGSLIYDSEFTEKATYITGSNSSQIIDVSSITLTLGV